MRIYLDTEFTDLLSPSILISIALVAEDDQNFYAEISDGWTLADCSFFVEEHVLPLLDHAPKTTMTRAEAAARLRDFLASFDAATICFDSLYDEGHFRALLGAIPRHVTLENINSQVDENIIDGYFGGSSGSRHHALADALALQYAHTVAILPKNQDADEDDVP